MPRSYHTKQKDEILQVIKQKGDIHFTAEEIAVSLKNAGSTIGLSTVYRQLDTMVKEGTLRKYLSSAGESACYQVSESCGEHFHLKCVACGKLEHLACSHLDGIREHVIREHGFLIDSSRTVFYGICKECGEK